MAWARIRQWLSRIRRRRPERPRLRLRYNPAKGLAGQTSADLVNTAALIAGLGAAPQLSQAFALFWALGIAIGVLTLGVAGFQWWRARREKRTDTWYLLAIATTAVGFFAIAASVTAIVMVALNPRDTGVVAGIVGWPAYLAWIAAEAVNAYENATLRPKTGPSNTSLAKSLLQMLGALLMWIFVVLTLKVEAARIAALFWSGAGVAVLGTLLGIVAGVWNLRRKSARRLSARRRRSARQENVRRNRPRA